MSYGNQPVSGGSGSVFTVGSGAPTGATPTTPAFYLDAERGDKVFVEYKEAQEYANTFNL